MEGQLLTGPALYHGLAVAVLALHLAFILWVVFGVLLTRNRPVLTVLHVASVIYGIFIEAGPWACPLTNAEQYFRDKAGLTPYQESFIVHYLEAVVYPDVPQKPLVWCAVLVCVLILGIYVLRFVKSRRPKSSIS